MSEPLQPWGSPLDKARAALAEAKKLTEGGEGDQEWWEVPHAEITYRDLVQIAQVQANIAQAEQLERIADVLERLSP